jgi:hypothetical protein
MEPRGMGRQFSGSMPLVIKYKLFRTPKQAFILKSADLNVYDALIESGCGA